MPNQFHRLTNQRPASAVVKLPHPVAHVGIDWLRICVPAQVIDSDMAAEIESNFDDLCAEGAKKLPKTAHFTRRIQVWIGAASVRLECAPVKSHLPYAFAAEFNPNRFTDAQLQEVFVAIRMSLGFDAGRLLCHAVIARIDANIDFAADLRGLVVDVAHKRGGMTVMRKLNGKAEVGSIYIGSNGADRRLRMYDKAQKNLLDLLKPHADKVVAALEWHTSPDRWPIRIERIRDAASSGPLWRMEIVNQPEKPMSIARLDEIAGCFDQVRLLNLPAGMEPFTDSTGKLFILAASLVGVPAALQQLDTNVRRRYRAALAKQPDVEWWNSKRYAGLICLALQRLKPILPDASRTLPLPQPDKQNRPVHFTRPAPPEIATRRAVPKLKRATFASGQQISGPASARAPVRGKSLAGSGVTTERPVSALATRAPVRF